MDRFPTLSVARALLDQFGTSIGRRGLLIAGAAGLLAAAAEWTGLALMLPFLRAITGEAALPDPVRAALDALGLAGGPETLLMLLALVAAARAGLNGWQEVLHAGMRVRFIESLRQRLFAALCGADWAFLMRQGHGTLTSLLVQEVMRLQQGIFHLLLLPGQILLVVVQLGVALWISPPATLTVVVVLVAFLIVVRGRRSSAIREGQRLTEAHAGLSDDIGRFLDTLKLAKMHQAEAWHHRAFAARMGRLSDIQMRFVQTSVRVRTGLQVAAGLVLALVVYVALTSGHLDGPEVLVLAAVLFRLAPVAAGVVQAAQHVGNALPALQAIDGMRTRAAAATEGEGGAGCPPLREVLTCRDLGFGYEPGHVILSGVSLTLRTGELVVFRGPSGSGKTTLADLLGGLLRPTEGRLEVDGVPLDASAAHAWRRGVAYVAQDPLLLDGTVRENLVWSTGDTGVRDADALWTALRQAAVDQVVAALPQGLDTPIGARGSRLSGGQRQRLALARALLRDPRILILDEPTSALDAETERRLAEAVRPLRAGRIVLVITHRDPALWKPDRVMTLGPDGLSVDEPGASFSSREPA